jgi:hypothetical protein
MAKLYGHCRRPEAMREGGYGIAICPQECCPNACFVVERLHTPRAFLFDWAYALTKTAQSRLRHRYPKPT